MKAFLYGNSQKLGLCGPGQTVSGPSLRIFAAGNVMHIPVQEEQNPEC